MSIAPSPVPSTASATKSDQNRLRTECGGEDRTAPPATRALAHHGGPHSVRALWTPDRWHAHPRQRQSTVVTGGACETRRTARSADTPGPAAARPARSRRRRRGLLPLDGAGRLAGHVQHDPVDLGHLVGDPGGDAGDQVVAAAATSRRSSRPHWTPAAARPDDRRCARRPGPRRCARRRAAPPGTATRRGPARTP